jgi:splicing factor 3B subunit 2
MGLTTAERNRRKREKKKADRKEKLLDEEEQQKSSKSADQNDNDDDDIEIIFVPEDLQIPEEFDGVRRLQERVAAVISDDERRPHGDRNETGLDGQSDDDDDEDHAALSKRKRRDMVRPSVAELKRRVKRPDLVEAHDITAPDPDFLLELKSVPGTVPVPRHWGRKRKYLQGKRGYEKKPFQLPDFIVKTGITEVRDGILQEEANQSIKQKNRSRVAPKLGAIDIDYNSMHAAFFKEQTKPRNMTKFGDLYYEGKELEVAVKGKLGGPLSEKLREALGMTSETDPPPWLLNMQRYGPPPSYPGLKIPGLNAALPCAKCQFGFHPGGWGKPPVDAYGRPLYGGNPFDPPGTSTRDDALNGNLVTSDGKTINKVDWGALPTGIMDDQESDDDEEEVSSGEEMEESDDEEEDVPADGLESVLPPPPSGVAAPVDLRKQAGDETPLVQGPPKQLYQVIDETKASSQAGAIFASETAYAIPVNPPPEGAESVLSKAAPQDKSKRKKKNDDDDELGKNFKF